MCDTLCGSVALAYYGRYRGNTIIANGAFDDDIARQLYHSTAIATVENVRAATVLRIQCALLSSMSQLAVV